MSLHRRLDEQTVLVTAVIVVVNSIFFSAQPLDLCHSFIFFQLFEKESFTHFWTKNAAA